MTDLEKLTKVFTEIGCHFDVSDNRYDYPDELLGKCKSIVHVPLSEGMGANFFFDANDMFLGYEDVEMSRVYPRTTAKESAEAPSTDGPTLYCMCCGAPLKTDERIICRMCHNVMKEKANGKV